MIDAPEKQAMNRNGDADGRTANGQFAPGCSGNPAGRPKRGEALADLIRVELDAAAMDGRLKREVLAATIVDRAVAGDFRFVKLLLDHARLDLGDLSGVDDEDDEDDEDNYPRGLRFLSPQRFPPRTCADCGRKFYPDRGDSRQTCGTCEPIDAGDDDD